MPSDDLLDHAKSDQDFYALLGEGIHPGSNEKEISAAYRRAALKSHPDKNPNDPNAVARFHALQIAYDVLSDPAAKVAYDNARAAREARKRQNEMLEGRRRAMKEDLERREGTAFKRKRDEMDAEERLEQEIRRLAEDGRRRRKEREEALLREQTAEKQGEAAEEHPSQAEILEPRPDPHPEPAEIGVPEISRTVKVRWAREGIGLDMSKTHLESLFGKFGKIESTLLLKDRKMRLGDEQKKRVIATGIVLFKSIVGAHAAVEDLKRQSGPEWKVFRSIEWAEGKEPDCLQARNGSTPSAINSEPASDSQDKPAGKLRKSFQSFESSLPSPSSPTFPSGDSKAAQKNRGGTGKAPSFTSFSSAKLNSSTPAPSTKSQGSPSFEEITMIRLKNAERRRLEEQIRMEEAQAED